MLLLEAGQAIAEHAKVVELFRTKVRNEIMAAVLEEVSVAGWVLVKPHRVQDRLCRIFELDVASPAKLQHVFPRQARQHQAQLATVKRAEEHGPGGSVCDR